MRFPFRLFKLACLAGLLSLGATAQDTAHIYVYSPWDAGQQSRLPITYDGVVVAKVKDGKFFAIAASPGRHVLVARDGVPTAVNVRPGEDAFVRVEHHLELPEFGKTDIPVLTVQSPDEARLAIVHLVYIAAGKISSPLVSRQDPTVQRQPALKTRPQP